MFYAICERLNDKWPGESYDVEDKMDACNAVDKELEKLIGRFTAYRESLDKIDELIDHVKATKNGIDEGLSFIVSQIVSKYMRSK